MRKIRLDLGRLQVESFVPAPQSGTQRGTVRGNSIATINHNPCGGEDPTPNCQDTQWEVETCGWTCKNECLVSGTGPGCAECT